MLYLGHRVPVVRRPDRSSVGVFIVAMGCHGELARTVRHRRICTSFYVSLSFGGMLGGLFAGLLAPYIFSWIAEYPILIALAVLGRPWTSTANETTWFWLRPWGSPALLVRLCSGQRPNATARQLDIRWSVLAALSVLIMRDARKSAVIVVLALTTHTSSHTEGHTDSMRSFFGVHLVFDTFDKRFRILEHGSTIHGARGAGGGDGRTRAAHDRSLTITTADHHEPRSTRCAPQGRTVARRVIGLGAGALACRITPNETWRFLRSIQS